MNRVDQRDLTQLCRKLYRLCRRHHLALALPPAPGVDPLGTVLVMPDGTPQFVEEAKERALAAHIFQKTLLDMKFAMLHQQGAIPQHDLLPDRLAPAVADVFRLLTANGRIALYVTVEPPEGEELLPSQPRILHMDKGGNLSAAHIDFSELMQQVTISILSEEERQRKEQGG